MNKVEHATRRYERMELQLADMVASGNTDNWQKMNELVQAAFTDYTQAVRADIERWSNV